MSRSRSARASTAASLRSVLKILNSVSSAVKVAPVSSFTASSPGAGAASAIPASCDSAPGTRRATARWSRPRLLVKLDTTRSWLLNATTATRSAGVICSRRKRWAAAVERSN